MRRELMKRFENSHELIGYTLNVAYVKGIPFQSTWLLGNLSR